MLRYDRQTKPGLVALYDIRPGNGAGPFLQPRSPHGAVITMTVAPPLTHKVQYIYNQHMSTEHLIEWDLWTEFVTV